MTAIIYDNTTKLYDSHNDAIEFIEFLEESFDYEFWYRGEDAINGTLAQVYKAS